MDNKPDQASQFDTSQTLMSIDDGFSFARKPRSLKGTVINAGMSLLQAMLQQIIVKGSLTLIGPDTRIYPIGSNKPSLTIPRLILHINLALGEAYMEGALTVEDGDIFQLLELCLSSLGRGKGYGLSRVHAAVNRLLRRIKQHNPMRAARGNVAHHYDLSDRLYELFLDADRQYSCAYFTSPEDTLEHAQEQKKQHLAAKLLLRPGHRILDIGSGWGGLALHLARTAAVDVTGVTLSVEQLAYAQHSAKEFGMDKDVRFLLKDYRQESGRYDRIVSVGMFEHVGVGHYHEFFTKIAALLEDDGVALVHTIGRADGPGAADAWINKYIFPGGYAPSLSEILPAIEEAGLYVTDVEVLRLHYAETLKAWRRRFNANRQSIAAIYDERFCRMWEFYLAGCEAGFRHSGLVNFQIQLSKRIDVVPLTRNYLYERQNCGSTA